MVVLEKQNKTKNIKIYKEAVKKIRAVIDESVPISHVGSTSVPYMYGKNIIDILIGARNEIELEEIAEKLISLGYYYGKNNNGMVYRFFANSKEETKSGDVHIHLAIIDSNRYKDFLILKNFLLYNKEERKKYSDFKKYILKQGYFNREEYKNLKSRYVNSLLERAKNSLLLSKDLIVNEDK